MGLAVCPDDGVVLELEGAGAGVEVEDRDGAAGDCNPPDLRRDLPALTGQAEIPDRIIDGESRGFVTPSNPVRTVR